MTASPPHSTGLFFSFLFFENDCQEAMAMHFCWLVIYTRVESDPGSPTGEGLEN